MPTMLCFQHTFAEGPASRTVLATIPHYPLFMQTVRHQIPQNNFSRAMLLEHAICFEATLKLDKPGRETQQALDQ